VGLIVLAKPVVELLFQGGRFVAANTEATVPIVQAYMLGVLPYSLVKVMSPAFFALDRPRVPMLASMSSVASNLVFNGLTYHRLGAAGLALGTTVGALTNLLVLRLAYAKVLGPAPMATRWHELVRLLLCNLILAGLALGCWAGCTWVLKDSGIDWPWGTRRLVHGILLFATIGIGFVGYGIVLSLMRLPDAHEIWELPKRILGKFRRKR
jgi:putative peptidoglycan lipid II flippase